MPDALDTDKPERKAMSQESEVTKLEPCPFRTENDDGEPHVVFIEWNRASVPHYWAECQTCDAHGPWERTREAAIASWNRRAPPADARLREAERAGLDAALLDAWRDTAIEECAQIVEHVAHNLPIGWGSASGGVVAQEAAARIRALRSSPAPLSPSKGARETPALDEAIVHLRDLVADSVNPSDFQAYVNQAEAELSALKSAAPERPAMACPGCHGQGVYRDQAGEGQNLTECERCDGRGYVSRPTMAVEAAQRVIRLWKHTFPTDRVSQLSGLDQAIEQLATAVSLTPAAASPTVKMPEREVQS